MSAHTISIVIPVYQGESSLAPLLGEIEPLTHNQRTPGGHAFRVTEVVLVHDCGPDRSDDVMRSLVEKHPFVSLVWLSRNFGQHAATLAGMAATSGDWVATLDEDGQQDPADVAKLLDAGLANRAQVVYGAPDAQAPHSWWRNATSQAAKWVARKLLGRQRLGSFYSFRLIQGEIARGLAAYCGESVYLDVALSWVAGRITESQVTLRPEHGRRSGYTVGRLVMHFWRLLITSGVAPLRLIAALGGTVAVLALLLGIYVVWESITGNVPVQGWSSLILTVAAFGGLILLTLGIIAEYVGITVSSAMGRPLYMTVSDPERPFRKGEERGSP
jgi:undecaprenyl-phosphate 4-deoxy-4-formamido-L-arabinose transferase